MGIIDRIADRFGFVAKRAVFDATQLDLILAREAGYYGRDASGSLVTPESALGVTTAYACVNVIATDVASLPLQVFRRRPDKSRERVTDHPVARLLEDSPDGETTSMRWRMAWVGHVLTRGNGYSEITFDDNGNPTGLYLLDPQTRAERNPQTRAILYRMPDRTALLPYRVAHLAGFGGDGLTGYSPIQLARQAFGLSMAAETFGAAFFRNASKPSGYIKMPQKLSEDAAKRLREGWQAVQGGAANVGKTAILEGGAEWHPISIPPEDAQFLETRKFQVTEICRLYRVPPHKVADLSQAHLANVEAANLDYLVTTLAPWCEAIEQELQRKLFTTDERRAGFYVEHQMQALLRGDMRARAEFYTRMRDLGALSPNEIRERENLNPIDGGDVYLVPLNMTSLANAGQVPDAAPVAARFALPGVNGHAEN